MVIRCYNDAVILLNTFKTFENNEWRKQQSVAN